MGVLKLSEVVIRNYTRIGFRANTRVIKWRVTDTGETLFQMKKITEVPPNYPGANIFRFGRTYIYDSIAFRDDSFIRLVNILNLPEGTIEKFSCINIVKSE